MTTRSDSAEAAAGQGDSVRPVVAGMLTPSEARADAAVPAGWQQFIDELAHGRSPALIEAWAPFAAELPSVRAFLSGQLKRLYVGREPDDTRSLLYLYTIGGRDQNVFRGRAPVVRVPERLLPVWDRVPRLLRDFYTGLHDGWTFLPANSMGPLPLADWAFLADDRFDIDPQIAHGMPIDVRAAVTVFHNGAGDYLCLDCGGSGAAEASGVIWWHDDPAHPEPVDFWGVLDAWIGIFLEDADRTGP